jgi:uncharacterized protein YecE (DUF72 family)
MPARVWIGTSGWIYRDWRGRFYPERLPARRWFEYYACAFETVEINNTFYCSPPARTFARWARQAPNEFRYAVKANRYLTHQKLCDPEEPLSRVLSMARILGPYLGPILYQLPPFWNCDPRRLAAFLKELPRDLEHVIEFRNPSWYTEEIRDLLADHAVGLCLHDMRGSVSPDWMTGPVVYIRLHGPTDKRYVGRYPRSAMEKWAVRIRNYEPRAKNIYVYFNNDYQAHAIANARHLQELVGLEVRQLDELPLFGSRSR